MKYPYIETSDKTSSLPRIQSTIKNKLYKNKSFEINSQYKPVKQKFTNSKSLSHIIPAILPLHGGRLNMYPATC